MMTFGAYSFGWLLLAVGAYFVWLVPHPFRWGVAYAWLFGTLTAFFPSWLGLLGANHPIFVMLAQHEAMVFLGLLAAFLIFMGVDPPIFLRDTWLQLFGFLALLCVVASPHPETEVLFLGNSRFTCAFVVLCFGGSSWWNLSASLTSIYLTQSLTGMLPFLVYLCSTPLIRSLPAKWKFVAYSYVIPMVSVITAYCWRERIFWKLTSRWDILKDSWNSAMHDGWLPALLGHGPGTWGQWGISKMAQRAFYGNAEMDYYPHNDFLQVLLDYGWVGFAIICGTAVWVVWKTKNKEARVDCLAYATVMLIQWPLHYTPLLLVAWVFAKEAWLAVPLQKGEHGVH